MTEHSQSIDEILLPRIRIDGVTRSDPSEILANGSDAIRAALIRLNGDPQIHAMLVQINGILERISATMPNEAPRNLLITSAALATTNSIAFDEAKAAHIPNDPINTQWATGIKYGSTNDSHAGDDAVRPGDAVIYLESRDTTLFTGVTNSFLGTPADGFESDFTMNLDRVLLHELAHILTRAPMADIGGSGATNPINLQSVFDDQNTTSTADDRSVNYYEDVAVLAENFLYVPFAEATPSTHIRLGHIVGQSPGGSSAMDAFAGFTVGRAISPASNQTGTAGEPNFVKPIEFSAFKVNGDASTTLLTLSYHQVGHEVQSGTLEQTYDHYLTFELLKSGSAAGLYTFTGSNVGQDNVLRDVLSDSLVQPATGPIPYDNLLSPAKSALDSLHSIAPFTSKAAVLAVFQDAYLTDIRPAHLTGLDRMVTISAERFTDTSAVGAQAIDVTGPVQAGTLNAADILLIDESDADTGTLIFGGSGYTNRFDFDSNTVDTAHASFALSYDHITGSDYSDVIILGTGMGIAKNSANGGAGHDILIGREGDDELHGGAGDDILIGGRGHNLIDGGEGFDIVSYADAPGPVAVGLMQPIPNLLAGLYGYGPYLNDELQNVEGVIGSAFNDDLRGAGGSLLIGGEGDDTFYLHSGDIAIGGGGHDTFILQDSGWGSAASRYAILDLNSEDTVRPVYGWTNDGPFSSVTTSIAFENANPEEPGRISIVTNSPAPGYWPEDEDRPIIQNIKYEIFVSDLQQSDFANLPIAFGPAYTGPSYDFHDIFGFI